MVWGSHISGSPHIIGQHHFRWFPCASNCVSLWCLSGLVEHPTGPGVGFHGDLRQLWSEAAKPGAGLRLSNDSFFGFVEQPPDSLAAPAKWLWINTY